MNLHERVENITYKEVLIIMTYVAFLILGILYFRYIIHFIKTLFIMMTPFFIGIIIAFILNIPMKYFIKNLSISNKKKKKLIAFLFSIGLFLLIVGIIFVVVLPQVIENIRAFVQNLPQGLQQLNDWIDYVLSQTHISQDMIYKIDEMKKSIAEMMIKEITSWVPSIAVAMTHMTKGIIRVFMGFVIAIYILLSKEQLFKQMKKTGQALLNDQHYKQCKDTFYLISSTFENFIAGQLTESIIIGVLCYIGCMILDIPYASIAGIVIGMTNIIPYFGPIIGACLSSVLILFISPMKTIVFLVFSTLLQQFESNLIYPHVVGSSVGLSPLWVLFAVSIGGGLFGIPGMVLGLPTFSIVYELFKKYIDFCLEKKKTV